MKWNKIKKAGSLLLTAALLAAMTPALPGAVAPVYGAEPAVSQFADKTALLETFDLDGTTEDKTAQKVYFGQNGIGGAQAWYIAGKDPDDTNGGLVLFAASPLTIEKFRISSEEISYNPEWGCAYLSGFVPEAVYPNHYGASMLRKSLHNSEIKRFSAAEQDLMKKTTITTYDTKNEKTYTIEDKLYVAHGNFRSYDNKYIAVGTNSAENLNGGLRIELTTGPYANMDFWLRAASTIAGDRGMSFTCCVLSGVVSNQSVVEYHGILPAFSLDPASILFASDAAPAASSDGALATGDTFTFRYEGAGLGSAVLSRGKRSAEVKNVPEGAYLVVQDASGAWAKRVNGTDIVNAEDITGGSLSSFADCKVWLEKTNTDRITEAVMAKQGTNLSVTVNPGGHTTKASGKNIQMIENGSAMEDVVYTADTGYYFPSDYGTGISTDGINVTRNSPDQITVSGTPTGDVLLSLPAPTKEAPSYGYVEYKVAIENPEDSHITRFTGEELQICRWGTAMKEVVYIAEEGYYFPENYAVHSSGGIAVKRDSYTQVTISGMPAADTTIQLKPAAEKSMQSAPSKLKDGGTAIAGTTAAMEYAPSADSKNWTPCSSGSTPVEEGVWYIRYKETATKRAGAAAKVIVVRRPAVPKVKASYTYNSVKLAWNSSNGAAGFQVYRTADKNGTYKKVKTTAAKSWTNSSLTTGKTYYYKVRAYRTRNGKTVYGSFTRRITVTPKTKSPSFSLSAGHQKIKVSWKGVSGATGYRIYRASSKKGTFKLIKVTGSKARNYTSYKLKNRHTYYYKIRSYRLVNGKKIYSNYSIVKSKKTR